MKIHIDLDSYFVSAERTLDKTLCGIPLAVGGRGDTNIFATNSGNQSFSNENSGSFVSSFFQTYDPSVNDIDKFRDEEGIIRGIITTSSYEARARGVRTAMSLSEAFRLCPNLRIKAPNMRLYQELSHTLHEYLQKRIPLIEQASIDEFYGDLSGWVNDDEALFFVDTLRHEIQRDLNLPVSIGVAKSKHIAKLATTMAKPFGCKLIHEHEIPTFVENISIETFAGIGRAMQNFLHKYNINTLGQLLRAKELLYNHTPYSRELYRKVAGYESAEIVTKSPRKSIGISRTFKPSLDRVELKRRVIILARHLAYAILKHEVVPTTFHFGIQYDRSNKTHANLSRNTLFSEKALKDLMLDLFYKSDTYKTLKIMHLSMSCGSFTKISRRELSLIGFEDEIEQSELSKKVHKVREKYGLDSLKFGSELVKKR